MMSAAVFFATIAAAAASLSNDTRQAEAEDGQLSWQSAFWALVSIAIGAAAQPSGSILGMPPRWGFALKCSPVMCLLNAFEALSCIRLQWRPRPKLTATSRKYSLQPTDSATALPVAVENNSTIRVVSFALGPIMSAIKLFACSGILYTKILAGCYLASFVCDELVLNLVWLSGRGSVDAAAPSLLATALSFAPSSNERQTAEPTTSPLPLTSQNPPIPSDSPTPDKPQLKSLADLAILANTILVAWFTSNVVFVLCFTSPNLFDWVNALATIVGIAIYAIFAVVKRYRKEGLAWILIWEFILRWSLSGLAVSLSASILRGGATLVSKTPSNVLTLYAEGVPSLVVLAGHIDFVGVLLIGGLRVAHILLGTYRITFLGDVIPGTRPGPYAICRERLKLLAGGWCLSHFVVALLTYYFTFDPERTSKPAWTEVLG